MLNNTLNMPLVSQGMVQIFAPSRPPPRLVLSEFQPSVMRDNGYDAAAYLRFFASRGYALAPASPTARWQRSVAEAERWLNVSRPGVAYDMVMVRGRAERCSVVKAWECDAKRQRVPLLR